MEKIIKYPTVMAGGFQSLFSLNMPEGAKIIHVNIDVNNIPSLWVHCNTEKPFKNRYFELYAEGFEMTKLVKGTREHVGSYRYQNGEFVGHIFELIGEHE